MRNPKQPNFQEIFFDTFSKQSAGIAFNARKDSNLNHDIHFIYSLIKDSRFRLGDVTHKRQTVEIKLSRARWELRDEVNKHNLIEIPSLLKFTRVRKIEFSASNVVITPPFSGSLFEESDEKSTSTLCEIDGFFIGESTYLGKSPTIELVLAGYPGYWSLRIYMDYENFGVSIKDQAI